MASLQDPAFTHLRAFIFFKKKTHQTIDAHNANEDCENKEGKHKTHAAWGHQKVAFLWKGWGLFVGVEDKYTAMKAVVTRSPF